MPQVARYAKLVAQQGRGPELAALLLKAADALADHPGCQLYLVNHEADDPDTRWVTELWRSQQDLDASRQQAGAGEGASDAAAAMALVSEPTMVELELLGGKGPGAGDRGAATAD